MIETALTLHNSGQLAKAKTIYQEVLQLQPDHAAALHYLGALASQVGSHDAAVRLMNRAVSLAPNVPAFHSNLGTVYQQLGRLRDAMTCFQAALQVDPTNADSYFNLGAVYQDMQQWPASIECYNRALEINSKHVRAINNLGIVYRETKDLERAKACFQNAIRLAPDFVAAHNNLGTIYLDQHDFSNAAKVLRLAFQSAPGDLPTQKNLGRALLGLGQLPEAMTTFQAVLTRCPKDANTHVDLGMVLHLQGKIEDALASFKAAIEIAPDLPEAHLHAGFSQLLTSNWEAGWREYEWRLKSDKLAVSPRCSPLWNGSSLNGQTLLVFAEQGLGDVLQFIRYLPLVKQRAGKVLLFCPPALLKLLDGFPGVDQVVARDQGLPAFDVGIPMMSLPRIFGTTPHTVPADVPYLSPSAKLLEYWQQKINQLPAGFKLGIAWQGNPKHPADRRRSIPLSFFERLASVDRVQLVSLQKGFGAEQLAQSQVPIVDLGSQLDNGGDAFVDTAAVMKHLDLIITSDTAIAHLAGAVGVPVWIALPRIPDWRWLLGRDDCPWYPSARLFRQQTDGNWDEVFRRIQMALPPFVHQTLLAAKR